jgi:hypothetical protein
VSGARSTVGELVRLTINVTVLVERAAVWRHAGAGPGTVRRSRGSLGLPRSGSWGLCWGVTVLLAGLDGLAGSVSGHSSGG